MKWRKAEESNPQVCPASGFEPDCAPPRGTFRKWSQRQDSNPQPPAYKAGIPTEWDLSGLKWMRRVDSNHHLFRFRA